MSGEQHAAHVGHRTAPAVGHHAAPAVGRAELVAHAAPGVAHMAAAHQVVAGLSSTGMHACSNVCVPTHRTPTYLDYLGNHMCPSVSPTCTHLLRAPRRRPTLGVPGAVRCLSCPLTAHTHLPHPPIHLPDRPSTHPPTLPCRYESINHLIFCRAGGRTRQMDLGGFFGNQGSANRAPLGLAGGQVGKIPRKRRKPVFLRAISHGRRTLSLADVYRPVCTHEEVDLYFRLHPACTNARGIPNFEDMARLWNTEVLQSWREWQSTGMVPFLYFKHERFLRDFERRIVDHELALHAARMHSAVELCGLTTFSHATGVALLAGPAGLADGTVTVSGTAAAAAAAAATATTTATAATGQVGAYYATTYMSSTPCLYL